MTFGIIGTGNMGSAIAKALCARVDGKDVFLANRTPAKAEALARELGATPADNETAARCTYVVLAVKPQMMGALLSSLRPVLEARRDRFVLVSVAAGLTINTLQEMAGSNYPVLRILPNTPVSIGAGMSIYSTSPELTKQELDAFLDACAKAGRFDEISEAQMDACCSLTCCTPAFVCLFLDALADGGVMTGLPREQALRYAAQTVLGAAAMVLETGEHPGALKDAVCSPGGSTIAGVAALEQAGLRAAAMDAVLASFARNKELGKG